MPKAVTRGQTAVERGRIDSRTWKPRPYEHKPLPKTNKASVSGFKTSGGVKKSTKYRIQEQEAIDSEDEDEYSSDDGDDGSGEFTIPTDTPTPGVTVHRRGQRTLPSRPTATPLHSYSSAKDIHARLVTYSNDRITVFPKPIFYLKSKNKKAHETVNNIEYTGAEDEAIQFVKKSSAQLIAIFMAPETGQRRGRPTANSADRHAYVLFIKCDGEKRTFAIWDGDTPQYLKDYAKLGKQYCFWHLPISCQRMIKGVAGKNLKMASGIWLGGYGNEGREECLELGRMALERAALGASEGNEMGADLVKERMKDLPFLHA